MSCAELEDIHISKLKSNYSKDDLDLYYERYSDSIRNSLDASLTKEIDMYECGDVDAFAAEVAAGMAVDGDSNDDILSERNAQMASMMIDVLRPRMMGTGATRG